MIEKPKGETRPTFAELLEKHGITVGQIYLRSVVGFGEDFDALVNKHIGIRSTIEDILQTLNELTGENYKLEDIYTRHIYGRAEKD